MKTYTFHVSIPGTGRVWRKIEMVGDDTLEDLHWAIQNAFHFEGDHLYSFFMSGKAWDRSTEYTLLEDTFEQDNGDDDIEPDDQEFADEVDYEEFDPEIDEESRQAILDSLGDEPPPESFEDMLIMISSNAELRGQMVKLMSEQTGIPEFVADALFKNANTLMAMMGESGLEGMFDDTEAQGDVRQITLEALEPKPDQRFLYLFDYGDEWRFQVKVDKIGDEIEPGVKYPRIVQSVGDPPPQYPDLDEDDEWYD